MRSSASPSRGDTSLADGLDYKYAWRWLLPSHLSDKLSFSGISANDRGWMLSEGAIGLDADGEASPDGVLINADRCADFGYEGKAKWLCAWGRGRHVDLVRHRLGDFDYAREFALIPPSSPRVCVPLSSFRSIRMGLSLHRPGRLFARAAVILAIVAAAIGFRFHLRRNVLLVAGVSDRSTPSGLTGGADFLNGTYFNCDFVVYFGHQSPERKTVVVPYAFDGPEAVIKSASSDGSRGPLSNEAAALRELEETIVFDRVPKLISFSNGSRGLSLVQEYRKREVFRFYSVNRAVIEFLTDLGRVDRRKVSFFSLVSGQVIASHEAYVSEEWLSNYVLDRWGADFSVYMSRTHGDFAVWNFVKTRKGIFVYDWERSCPSGLSGSDAFYYVVSPFLHVRKNPDPEIVLSRLIRFSRRLYPRLGIPCEHIEVYVGIWLIAHKEVFPLYAEMLDILRRRLTCRAV